MYHVLLVDDEESVLNVLRTSIDWQGLGIETLLTANDGIAALEVFEQQAEILQPYKIAFCKAHPRLILKERKAPSPQRQVLENKDKDQTGQYV